MDSRSTGGSWVGLWTPSPARPWVATGDVHLRPAASSVKDLYLNNFTGSPPVLVLLSISRLLP